MTVEVPENYRWRLDKTRQNLKLRGASRLDCYPFTRTSFQGCGILRELRHRSAYFEIVDREIRERQSALEALKMVIDHGMEFKRQSKEDRN
jgi:hypothetical protein